MSGFNHAAIEFTIREPWRARQAVGARSHGCGEAVEFRPCDLRYHPGQSCTRFFVTSLPSLVLRLVKMYAPVHFLPLLLFRFKKVVNDPVKFLLSTTQVSRLAAD